MATARFIGVTCGLLAALTTLASRTADACSSAPVSGFDGLVVLPAMDTIAPRNTLIWVPEASASSYLDPPYTADDIVVKVGDVTIATTTITIITPYPYDEALWVLVPDAPLPTGAAVVMLKRDVISRFTVDNVEDLSAPTPPKLTRVEVEGAYFGGFSCPEDSTVTVSTDATDAIVLLLDRVAGATLPTTALAAGVRGKARAYDLAEGEQQLFVVAVDVAGNLSSTTRLPAVTIPTETSGCSVGAPSRAVWSVLLALVVLVARRRRR